MGVVTTTINITREITSSADDNTNYDYTNFIQAIQTTLQENFYDILNRNGINTISMLNQSGNKDISVVVSNDATDNTITISINRKENGAFTELAIIECVPYISWVKYSQYTTIGEHGFSDVVNSYKPVATILISVLIDNNICGFSFISPKDIQIADVENNIYTVKNNITINEYYGGDYADGEDDTDITSLPEVIKLQTKTINDIRSYYEILYNDINDPYTVQKVPCINSVVYVEANTMSFKSLFNTMYVNFNTDDELGVLGTMLMNNKLLCDVTTTTNETGSAVNNITDTIEGFSTNIYDCPALNVSDYWVQDSQLNVGSTITIDDSDYVIADKNTIIQLANTEIYGINTNVVYDGKPHFFGLVYPIGSTAEYRLAGTDTWYTMPSDTSTIDTFVNAGNYEFEYKITIPSNIGTTKKEYYGNVTLNIANANQYGYLVNAYNNYYDALPHTVYIFTDADVTYSTDGVNWSVTAPTFTEVGSYTVYYRLTQTNYTTVSDSIDVNILALPEGSDIDGGIDVTKNIIVMREQMYSEVTSNLFIWPTQNSVYLSNGTPTNINVSNFDYRTSEDPNATKYGYPNPMNEGETSILGTFKVSPNNYCLVIECYMPWYKQPNNTNIQFTVKYCDDYNDATGDSANGNSGWTNIASNVNPSNGFYEYKISDVIVIDTEENPAPTWMKSMVDANNEIHINVKRLVVKLPLSAAETGNDYTKAVRIMCTNLNNSTSASVIDISKYIAKPYNGTLGVSLISMTKYDSGTNISYNANNLSFIKFKSALSSDAWFTFNVGNNLQYNGLAKVVKSVTGTTDNTALLVEAPGDNANNQSNYPNDDTEANNWTTQGQGSHAFGIVKDELSLIQFNSDKIVNSTDPNGQNRYNSNYIYAYIPCVNS